MTAANDWNPVTSVGTMAAGTLAGWLPVTNGESGAIVRRSSEGTRFAKAVGLADIATLAAERDRVIWLEAEGIPCPRVLDWIDGDEGAVLVTSAVPGVGADRLSAADLAQAWPGIGRAVRRLHKLDVDSCPFRGHHLIARMTLAQDVVARGVVNPQFLSEADRLLDPVDILADLERDVPRMRSLEARDAVVCHGDCCLPNIMIDPETLAVTGFVDLGRLGIADRHADLALLTANARETWPDEAAAQVADAALSEGDHYGVALELERLAFYLRLDPLTWG
jgi:streptomycin 3"-kinase